MATTTKRTRRGAGIKSTAPTQTKVTSQPTTTPTPTPQEKPVQNTGRIKLTNEPVGDLRTYLQIIEDWKEVLFDLLPPDHPSTRFIRMARNCWQTTPALKGAARSTVLNALAIAAQLGLCPNGVGGEAWIACYKAHWLPDGVTEATILIGYQGALTLMRNHPSVAMVDAKCVFEKDTFEWSGGTAPYVHHDFALSGDRGEPVGAYAVAYLHNASIPLLVMLNKAEIEKRRGQDSLLWERFTDVAYMKTAVLQLAKIAPRSTAMTLVVEIESRREQGKPTIDLGPLHDDNHSQTYSRTDELANQLDANQ